MAIKRYPMSGFEISEAVVVESAGRWVYLSGVIALDGGGRGIVPGGVAEQTRTIFRHMEEILGRAGARLDDVIKLTSYLTDMSAVGDFSAVRREVWADRRLPAATTVEVGRLALGAAVEIEAVAFVEQR